MEDKGLSLSVHFRQVEARKTGEVKSTFEHIVSNAQALGRIRITQGKKVYEVRPAVAWDKGKAVKLLMKRCGKGGRRSGLLPIYLGDDLTDEDAFRTLGNKGLTVRIGRPRSSAAAYYLSDTRAAAGFLRKILLAKRTKRWPN